MAQSLRLPLSIVPALAAEVSVEPDTLYPGLESQVRMSIRNLDSQARRIDAVQWIWPEGLTATASRSDPVAVAGGEPGRGS